MAGNDHERMALQLAEERSQRRGAGPFNWKHTAADLAGLLQRIGTRHEPARLPQAA